MALNQSAFQDGSLGTPPISGAVNSGVFGSLPAIPAYRDGSLGTPPISGAVNSGVFGSLPAAPAYRDGSLGFALPPVYARRDGSLGILSGRARPGRGGGILRGAAGLGADVSASAPAPAAAVRVPSVVWLLAGLGAAAVAWHQLARK